MHPHDHISEAVLTLPHVYKSFTEPEHAVNFSKGLIKVTTLYECHSAPGDRGDRGEGYLVHEINEIAYDPSDRHTRDAMEQTGAFRLGPGAAGSRFIGIGIVKMPTNLFLLCLSDRYNPAEMNDRIGEHWVRINDLAGLFDAVTKAISEKHKIRYRVIDRVRYEGRVVTDYETRDEVLRALYKPPTDNYTYQNEIRMAWAVEEPRLHSDIFKCEDAAGLSEVWPQAIN